MTKEEIVSKAAAREHLTGQMKGRTFRRQVEYLTDKLLDEQFASEQYFASWESAKKKIATIEPELTEYQNLEHAIVPDGMTFKSYFEQLEAQIAELQAVRRDLLKLSEGDHDKITKLKAENEALKRRAEACEESKTKSETPPPTEETKSEPKEPESTTPLVEEGEGLTDEEWEKCSATLFEEGEETESSEVPPKSEALTAFELLVAAALPPATTPIDFQALLDEALKG